MADPQAQDTLRQSHQVAQQGLGMAANVLQKAHAQAMAPPQAHPEIMQALQQLQQGQQQGGPGGPAGQGQQLPDPADLVAQDPQQAVMYADAILHAVSQHIMAQAAPAGPSVPVPPPNVGGAHSGF